MENNKISQDFLKQLKRIADALEKSNKLEETVEKRNLKIYKLEEKIKLLNLKSLRESVGKND